jgi:AraC family transcriptional regulator
MLMNSIPANSLPSVHGNTKKAPHLNAVSSTDGRSPISGTRAGETDGLRLHRSRERTAIDAAQPLVDIAATEAVRRQTLTWRGMAAELVQPVTPDRIEFRFKAPVHLLAVYIRSMRHEGDTFVEGAPQSSLRNLTRKLTFVPANHEYREWHEPNVLPRVLYFYFDPARFSDQFNLGAEMTGLVPRVFFEDASLWDTAAKLRALVENPTSDNRPYVEALGVVLAHEVARFSRGTPRIQPHVRGGLAAWQERIVVSYIEEHLTEQISLATLARLVHLSTFYFCRAFKQSFGMPPRRYHTMRRIERAKILLAKPSPSVTDIGFTLGFSQTSTFSAAFRKATGRTPTSYHRSLG